LPASGSTCVYRYTRQDNYLQDLRMKTLKFWVATIALCLCAGNVFADTLQTEVAEYAKAYSDHNWVQVKLSKVSDSDPTSVRVLAIASRMARLTDKKWELCVFDQPLNCRVIASLFPGHWLTGCPMMLLHGSSDMRWGTG
jgi:hypothetical protein